MEHHSKKGTLKEDTPIGSFGLRGMLERPSCEQMDWQKYIIGGLGQDFGMVASPRSVGYNHGHITNHFATCLGASKYSIGGIGVCRGTRTLELAAIMGCGPTFAG